MEVDDALEVAADGSRRLLHLQSTRDSVKRLRFQRLFGQPLGLERGLQPLRGRLNGAEEGI